MTPNHRSTVVHRFLPGVDALPEVIFQASSGTQRGAPLYLRQGDLDGACGIYCLLMALIACDLLTRSDIGRFSRMRGPAVHESFFEGTDGADLARISETLAPRSRVNHFVGAHAAVLMDAEREFGRGRAVLLAVEDRLRRYSHWVFLIGAQYTGFPRGPTTALLALDPGSAGAEPSLQPFNWKLLLDNPRRGSRYLTCLDSAGSRRLVTCTEALSLRAGEEK